MVIHIQWSRVTIMRSVTTSLAGQHCEQREHVAAGIQLRESHAMSAMLQLHFPITYTLDILILTQAYGKHVIEGEKKQRR